MSHILLSILFVLATAFTRSEQVTVLHASNVHVIAPQCDRVDQWTNFCAIRDGQQLTPLRVEMPCAVRRTQLFFSVVRVGYMRNWNVWIENPAKCDHSAYMPLVGR